MLINIRLKERSYFMLGFPKNKPWKISILLDCGLFFFAFHWGVWGNIFYRIKIGPFHIWNYEKFWKEDAKRSFG